MVARQFRPIETSSPVEVARPLWQAMHRSEVWKMASGLPWVFGGVAAGRAASSVRSPAAAPTCLPAIAKASVEEVPEQIEHELCRARAGVGHRNAQADAGEQVLRKIQGRVGQD